MANVSVAKRTLTNPRAKRISTTWQAIGENLQGIKTTTNFFHKGEKSAVVYTNAPRQQVTHSTDLRKFLVRTYTLSSSRLANQNLACAPFSRITAFSIVTCISLFSAADERSTFVRVPAFCSHFFFEKVKITTGSRALFRRRPIR